MNPKPTLTYRKIKYMSKKEVRYNNYLIFRAFHKSIEIEWIVIPTNSKIGTLINIEGQNYLQLGIPQINREGNYYTMVIKRD